MRHYLFIYYSFAASGDDDDVAVSEERWSFIALFYEWNELSHLTLSPVYYRHSTAHSQKKEIKMLQHRSYSPNNKKKATPTKMYRVSKLRLNKKDIEIGGIRRNKRKWVYNVANPPHLRSYLSPNSTFSLPFGRYSLGFCGELKEERGHGMSFLHEKSQN